MEPSPAAQPAPDRRAAEEANEGFGMLPRDDTRRRDDEDTRRRDDEDADRRAAEEVRRRRQAAKEIELAEQQALGLSVSRKLVEASNTATAVLEADTAFSKLAYTRPSAFDLPFFEEQAQLDREQYLAKCMIMAGRDLVSAFTELLNTPSVWGRLADSEHALRGTMTQPFRTRMVLAELITQHIPEVLLSLGYRPPPPAEDWTDLVQNSLQNMLSIGKDLEAFARNSASAQKELTFFTRRLRACVETAEKSQGQDEQDGGSRLTAFRSSLRTFVLAARNRAIPAALAAGASGAVTGAVAGPAGIGIGALSGATASILGTATEAATTAWLAEKGTQGDTPVMASAQVLKADIEALSECVELMRSATSATIERIHFIIRRGVFQTLQEAASCTVPVQDKLWKLSGSLLSLLDAEIFLPDEADRIVDEARKLFA